MKNLLLRVATAVCCVTSHVPADEGMWLLTRPPTAEIQARYGFAPDAAWLMHMQKSAVRFESGGSGSVVSDEGLVMTNHHVGSESIAKLSTPTRDLMAMGFLARTREEELPCPDLELRILWEIQDVTSQVRSAADAAAAAAESGAAIRKSIAEIEAAAKSRTGLTAQVVTLYQGGLYHLYLYKSFTDVRLVFAPEQTVAFFGGDADNFEFPRYNLDCCFFRIYENGKPYRPTHHLKWSALGAKENDLIFVFGHPGLTRRSLTVDHLRFIRDVDHPARLAYLWRTEAKLAAFAGRSKEFARMSREDRFGVANGRKAYTGQLSGLQDPTILDAKREAERDLAARVKSDPALAEVSKAWEEIAAAQDAHRVLHERRYAMQRLRQSILASAALDIVRLADELAKPNGERLPEYTEASLPSTYLSLYSDQPIYPELEIQLLGNALGFAAERLGVEDAMVSELLAGRSPMDRARDMVTASELFEPSRRRALVESGKAGVEGSEDPLIQFAKVMDGPMRRLNKAYQDSVESVEVRGYARIAEAKFRMNGESDYPDATFTLRLSYGKVTGLNDEGREIPPFTTLGGLFERYEERKGQEGFELEARWFDAKPRLNPQTPFNFVCTADIIGGNSGSPVVNQAGEVVGLIFDGNIHSLTGAFAYDATKNRAVAVDARGMLEAMRVVYGAEALVAELLNR